MELRETKFERNSLVYQKIKFDRFYRQINTTTVKGPFTLRLISHIIAMRVELGKFTTTGRNVSIRYITRAGHRGELSWGELSLIRVVLTPDVETTVV